MFRKTMLVKTNCQQELSAWNNSPLFNVFSAVEKEKDIS